MENLKYEYHLYTWGGFYNEQHAKTHKQQSDNFWFDSFAKRQKYIEELLEIQEKLNAKSLAFTQSEGYCCRTETILHRVIEFEGEKYYSNYSLGFNYPYDAAKYHLEEKWYLDNEHFPFVNEENKHEIKVIQEWITGAFKQDLD